MKKRLVFLLFFSSCLQADMPVPGDPPPPFLTGADKMLLQVVPGLGSLKEPCIQAIKEQLSNYGQVNDLTQIEAATSPFFEAMSSPVFLQLTTTSRIEEGRNHKGPFKVSCTVQLECFDHTPKGDKEWVASKEIPGWSDYVTFNFTSNRRKMNKNMKTAVAILVSKFARAHQAKNLETPLDHDTIAFYVLGG